MLSIVEKHPLGGRELSHFAAFGVGEFCSPCHSVTVSTFASICGGKSSVTKASDGVLRAFDSGLFFKDFKRGWVSYEIFLA